MNKITFYGYAWLVKLVSALLFIVVVIVLVGFVHEVAQRTASYKISCPRCNVVILDIDTFRSDDLNCSTKSLDLTPNLCRLVRQGVRFSRAYSQSYWTLPSSLSTFTSLYPSTIRVWNSKIDTLNPSVKTLASYLKSNAYDTYYSGGDNDNLLTQRNGGLNGYAHIEFHSPGDNTWLDKYKAVLNSQTPVLFHAYSPWLHMPYLIESNQSPIKNLPKPKGFPEKWSEYGQIFKIYLVSHVADVFKPQTIAEHPEIFQSSLQVRNDRIFDYFTLLDSQKDYTKRNYAWQIYYNSYMQFINTHNPADVAYLRMMYDTKVHTLDTSLSGFVDYLLRPDVADHTVVVITSSHGEAFGEHGVFSHEEEPYNELYHVPLIIKYPHSVGKQIDSVVENIDIFPTLAEMITGNLPSGIWGTSLVPMLSGFAAQAKSYAISMNSYVVYVIQNRRYALVVHRDNSASPELYDLVKDPEEKRDIAAMYPKIVDQMVHLLISTRVQRWFWLPKSDTPASTSPEKQKSVRGGYF